MPEIFSSSFRADLHCHSQCSDGSLSVSELLHLAKERGLGGLAITDHDTIAAYDTGFPIAKELGILLLSGIEFSCVQNGASVHLLGYAFDLRDEGVHQLCEHHRQRRAARLQRILEKLAKHGMPLSETEIIPDDPRKPRSDSVGRPHIAHAMVRKGYVSDVQQAFKRYLGDGKPCYEPGSDVSVEESIDVIHGACGEAILAHPHLIKSAKTVREVLKLELDGIEGYYSLMPRSKEQRWVDLAAENEWLLTGGSDFHGAAKPQVPLGCSWTPEPSFRKLYDLFLSNNPHIREVVGT